MYFYVPRFLPKQILEKRHVGHDVHQFSPFVLVNSSCFLRIDLLLSLPARCASFRSDLLSPFIDRFVLARYELICYQSVRVFWIDVSLAFVWAICVSFPRIDLLLSFCLGTLCEFFESICVSPFCFGNLCEFPPISICASFPRIESLLLFW